MKVPSIFGPFVDDPDYEDPYDVTNRVMQEFMRPKRRRWRDNPLFWEALAGAVVFVAMIAASALVPTPWF